ncbi:MAG: MPT63 family protein, partial [Mycobacterium sp.]
MKIKPALGALSVAAATAIGVSAAPLASAETEVEYLGQPAELVDGNVIQHWTVTGLKPSTDTIPYQAAGTLWEATATDEAIAGSATPIVSNLNARAGNGETYRVLFGVATPQGVNPSTLPQGEKTTGKIYFDVTGEQPDSVVYNAGGTDLLLWVEPPPAPATDSAAAGSSPAQVYDSPSDSSDVAETATPATSPTPGAEPATETPAPTAATATPAPAGSTGTPLPEGSSGTPLP